LLAFHFNLRFKWIQSRITISFLTNMKACTNQQKNFYPFYFPYRFLLVCKFKFSLFFYEHFDCSLEIYFVKVILLLKLRVNLAWNALEKMNGIFWKITVIFILNFWVPTLIDSYFKIWKLYDRYFKISKLSTLNFISFDQS